MPSFVPPESSSFSVDEGKATVRVQGFTVTEASGWSLVPRATLVVIDGPGDEGFLFARLGEDGTDRAPPNWDEAVDRHGGAWLVVGDAVSIFAPLVD